MKTVFSQRFRGQKSLNPKKIYLILFALKKKMAETAVLGQEMPENAAPAPAVEEKGSVFA
jgi:hypothetical protein